MKPWIPPLLAGVGALALAATSVTAVVQSQRARDATARAEDAEARVADLQARVDDLERRLDDADPDNDTAPDTDPFADLLDGLVGDLFGSAGGIPGAECLVSGGGGGLEDLIDGLFGGSSTAPGDPDALVAQAADEVAALRELGWEQDVDVAFLDDEAMRDRLLELFDDEYSAEDADVEARLLTALGALPADSDVRALRRQLLEDQVAGFYDPETGELVVRTPSGGIAAADRITLAHELDHALTDQALGLPDLEAERFDGDDDALLAALAVIEGDATLLMSQWALGSLGLGEQLSMALDPSLLAAQESLDEMPPYLAAELLFPYTDGLDHVCDLWLDDGWDGIDAAYDDLPTTTAMVLWSDHPGRTADPTALAAPTGYEQTHTTTFGAAQLLWLLEAPGGVASRALDDAEQRARAWGGGQLTLWDDGTGSAVGLSLVDTGSGAPLCATVTAWYAAAFPDASRRSVEDGAVAFDGQDHGAVVACDDESVRLGIAPDVATATAITSP